MSILLPFNKKSFIGFLIFFLALLHTSHFIYSILMIVSTVSAIYLSITISTEAACFISSWAWLISTIELTDSIIL